MNGFIFRPSFPKFIVLRKVMKRVCFIVAKQLYTHPWHVSILKMSMQKVHFVNFHIVEMRILNLNSVYFQVYFYKMISNQMIDSPSLTSKQQRSICCSSKNMQMIRSNIYSFLYWMFFSQEGCEAICTIGICSLHYQHRRDIYKKVKRCQN